MEIPEKVYALKYGRIYWDYSFNKSEIKPKANKLIFLAELYLTKGKGNYIVAKDDDKFLFFEKLNFKGDLKEFVEVKISEIPPEDKKVFRKKKLILKKKLKKENVK